MPAIASTNGAYICPRCVGATSLLLGAHSAGRIAAGILNMSGPDRGVSGANCQPTCAVCGAELFPHANVCWLCYAPVESTEARNLARAIVQPEQEHVGTFSLSTLMIFVTQVCVLLGVWTLWPGLGIVLAAVLLAIWLVTATRALPYGNRVAARDALFSSTMALILLVAIAGVIGCIAFVTVITAFLAAFTEACSRFPGM
jgi:hypothetical protein